MNREPNQVNANLTNNTEVTVKFHEPIKVSFDHASSIPIIIAVVGVISSMIAAIAKFGGDGIGKHLTVILTIAFSLLLIGALILKENQWGGIALIATGVLSLAGGLCIAKEHPLLPKSEPDTQAKIPNT